MEGGHVAGVKGGDQYGIVVVSSERGHSFRCGFSEAAFALFATLLSGVLWDHQAHIASGDIMQVGDEEGVLATFVVLSLPALFDKS